MKWLIVALLAIVTLAISPWAIAMTYMQLAGRVVDGTITGKREAIVMPGGDSWDHLFEISYKYQPIDSRYPETATHRVDSAVYRHTKIDSIARVRYSPLRILRPVVGLGSFLDESSLLSRLGIDLFTTRHLIVISLVSIGLLTAFFAFSKKSGALGVFAAWVLAIPAPVPFLAITAFIVFPALYLSWRSRKNAGYGLLLVCSIPLTAAAVYWQIPQPPAIPAHLQRKATAVVRQVRVVDEIWTNYGKDVEDAGGQGVRQPFQMVDLEFRPDGASDSVHALDRLDMNSVPGLRQGATVHIEYSLADPSSVSIQGGTGNYARATLVYLLTLTYGVGGTLVLLMLGLARAERFFRSLTKHLRADPPGQGVPSFSRVPPANHPRRETIEKVLRTLQKKEHGR